VGEQGRRSPLPAEPGTERDTKDYAGVVPEVCEFLD